MEYQQATSIELKQWPKPLSYGYIVLSELMGGRSPKSLLLLFFLAANMINNIIAIITIMPTIGNISVDFYIAYAIKIVPPR